MKANRVQAVPLHPLRAALPTKLRRPWRLDRLAWGDFAWLLLVIFALWLLGWQMARFLEGG